MRNIYVLMLLMLLSCQREPTEWRVEQRASIRRLMDNYRPMIYLNNLDDVDFSLFADHITGIMEMRHPRYTEFIAMPSMSDTIRHTITQTIVRELRLDARQTRHLYPHRQLLAEGILPPKLTERQVEVFYQRFWRLVQDDYPSLDAFLEEYLHDSTLKDKMRQWAKRSALTLQESEQLTFQRDTIPR